MDFVIPFIVLLLAIAIPFALIAQSLLELTFGTNFDKDEAQGTSGVRKDNR